MKAEIMASESFKRAWGQLTPQMRSIVRAKVRLLVVNPGYPSLQVHRLRRARGNDIRVCYISNTVRLVFEIREGILCLWDLGSHAVVDKVHKRSFSRPTCFLRLFEKSSRGQL